MNEIELVSDYKFEQTYIYYYNLMFSMKIENDSIGKRLLKIK